MIPSIIQLIVILAVIALALSLPIDHQNESSDTHGNKNPMYGDHFEGDLLLSEQQRDAIFRSSSRTGLLNAVYRWPNKTVPYELSPNHTQKDNAILEIALRKIASVSCLKFVRRTHENDYIALTAQNNGCYSWIGRVGGRQALNLIPTGPKLTCFKVGIVMHEFLHALGFFHMQSASDRDKHVKINWQNIQNGMESNFAKYDTSVISHFNGTYDYVSIMHYDGYAFSKNGHATIVPKNINYIKTMGHVEKLSAQDISKLNAMYKC